jgi:hypothetical protein
VAAIRGPTIALRRSAPLLHHTFAWSAEGVRRGGVRLTREAGFSLEIEGSVAWSEALHECCTLHSFHGGL